MALGPLIDPLSEPNFSMCKILKYKDFVHPRHVAFLVFHLGIVGSESARNAVGWDEKTEANGKRNGCQAFSRNSDPAVSPLCLAWRLEPVLQQSVSAWCS
jgi:hypothetical protein